jgi:glycosyltransferase involved in cell wall biosynthesis
MAQDHLPTDGVSILMPAYNLGDSIGAGIDRVVAATSAMTPVEIVVADDGSADTTRREAETAASAHPNVVVVGHRPNQGKGAALQAAFSASTRQTVVFLDGDLDLPPEQLPALVEHFRASGLDALVGTKQGAMEPGRYPLLRRVLSRTFSGVIKLLFRLPVGETQTGLKVFRRDPLAEVLPRLRVKRYTYDLELIVALHRRGYAIGEVPVELAEGASESGVSLGTLWEMGRDTLRIWLRAVFGRL